MTLDTLSHRAQCVWCLEWHETKHLLCPLCDWKAGELNKRAGRLPSMAVYSQEDNDNGNARGSGS